MDAKIRHRDYKYRSTFAQVLASLAANTSMVNVGLIFGMPVFVIGALRGGDPDLSFTQEEASWFGSMMFLVQPLGALMSGFLQGVMGRKTSMMVFDIPQFVAWIMIYKASSVTSLYAAIIILGLGMGTMEAPVLSYKGEVCEPRLRGVIASLAGVSFNVGLLVEGFIGAAVGWRLMALFTSVAPVISFVCLALVPESPAWLVSKGQAEKARRSYQWLRGWVPPDFVQQELDSLVNYFDNTAAECKLNLTVQNISESKLRLFFSPSVLRPLRLIVLFFIISNCASMAAIRPFFMKVLNDLNLPISSDKIIVLISLLSLLGGLTTTFTLRRTGKRVITFISLGVCTACCLGLGAYLALGLHLPWMPVVLFSLSSYSSSAGIIFLPWILVSEIFPLRVRGEASAVAGAIAYLTTFTNIKIYYNIVSMIHVSGACFLYGTVGLVGLIYLYFNLPETEGAALESIERFYSESGPKSLTLIRTVQESGMSQ